MKDYKVFVINPGSTSTKLKMFVGKELKFETSVFHDVTELTKYPDVIDQLDFRYEVIKKFIIDNNIAVNNIDAIVGRGGGCYTVPSGVFEVNDLLVNDIKADKYGSNHASNLGVPLAVKMQADFGGRVFMTLPTCVDELTDEARVTGLKGVYRTVASHCLNLKGTGEWHAEHVMGKKFEDCNFVIAHIDGGTTICASRKGRQIDCNDGAGGDGPFAGTRCGGIAVKNLLDYLHTHSEEEVRVLTVRSGGISSHFGTSNADVVHQKVLEGDPYAKVVWDALIYNNIKYIGSMAAALDGEVDAVLVTGGYLRFNDICEEIKKRCSWIAPVYLYPGEQEDYVMANAAIKVLSGALEPMTYTGKPVWDGFDFEKEKED